MARPRRSRLSYVVGMTVLFAPVLASASADNQDCFTERDNRGLSFAVIQQAPPPTSSATAYKFYPLSGVASMQLTSLDAAKPGYDLYYFQWANRSNAPLLNAQGRLLPRKSNFQQSSSSLRRQRTAFSSVARADACTLAQAANALGREAEAQRFAAAGGIGLARESEQPDDGPAGPEDVCVMGNGRLPPRATGLLLDYEVQDRRSGADTLAFLRAYTDLVHGAGRKAVLLINPFDAPSQIYTGITPQNAHAIVSMFDLTTIFLWSGNRERDLLASYRAQKAMITAGGAFDASRVLIDFELMGTTLRDAQLVRRLIIDDHLAGVLLWRNYAAQGGACTTDVNMKIATVALGHLK